MFTFKKKQVSLQYGLQTPHVKKEAKSNGYVVNKLILCHCWAGIGGGMGIGINSFSEVGMGMGINFRF